MNILHIAPQHDSLITQYVSLLSTHLGIDTTMRTACDATTLRQICAEWQPQVVHVHGLLPQDVSLSLLKKKFSPMTPVVFTAMGPVEAQELKKQGYPRIEIIRNPIVTRTITIAEAARQVEAVYQKGLHSNILLQMNAPTRQALQILLKAGIHGDRRWLPADTSLNDAHWDQLFVYAKAENVTDVVAHGLQVMQSPSSMPTLKAIGDGYLPEQYECPHDLEAQNVVELVVAIHQAVEHGQLALRWLVQLHRYLLSEQVEDDVLMKELKHLHQQPFMGSLMALLQEQTLLPEGFMPCAPLNNSLTQQLKSTLHNHLLI